MADAPEKRKTFETYAELVADYADRTYGEFVADHADCSYADLIAKEKK